MPERQYLQEENVMLDASVGSRVQHQHNQSTSLVDAICGA